MLSEKFILEKNHGGKVFFMGKKISILSRRSLANGNKAQKNNCAKNENPNLYSNPAPLCSPIYLLHSQDWG